MVVEFPLILLYLAPCADESNRGIFVPLVYKMLWLLELLLVLVGLMWRMLASYNKRCYSYTGFKPVALFCHLVGFDNELNVFIDVQDLVFPKLQTVTENSLLPSASWLF